MTRRWWSSLLGSPSGLIGTVLVVVLVIVAIAGPPLAGPAAAHIDVAAAGQGPSWAHLLGTNELGQDIGARVVVATRLSLLLALAATVLTVVLGVVLGAAPTLSGRGTGRVVDTVIRVSVAFPGLLLVLFLAVVFGVTTTGAVLAVGLSGIPHTARLVRNLVQSIESREYVAAARLTGAGRFTVLVRHILPNAAEPLLLNTANSAAGVILTFAGLSFLGIGIQAPDYDWGALLGKGQSVLYTNPAAVLGPGVAVVLAGLALNLLGEVAARTIADGGSAPAGSVPSSVATPEVTAAETGRALNVRGLRVTYRAGARVVKAVRGVSFSVAEGEKIGIVGESGSGKSTVAMAVARLIEPPAVVAHDELVLNGLDVAAGVDRRQLAAELGVVFQDPMSSLNPVRRLAAQLTDGVRYHEKQRRRPVVTRLVERLTAVGVERAATRVHDYPHQFSGGMRQRAVLAMALLSTPRLVIADEPTTALDVTTENRVLGLLKDVCEERGAALLLISHDLTVINRACERVLVMYAGRLVEDLPVGTLWTDSCHPYTRALLTAVPTLRTDRDRPLTVIPGRVADPADEQPGCAFAPRCPVATSRCRTEDPPLAGEGHRVACWNPLPSGRAVPITTAVGARDDD